MKKTLIPASALEFFRESGAEGGKSRAKKHTAEQLSEWGKMGGRPKRTGKKAATKAKKGGK